MRHEFAPIGRLTERCAARFWEQVKLCGADECWPYTGSKSAEGYGIVCLSFGRRRANRVAWALANGRDPDGIVCHHCDNPTCCNPAHLWIGADADNQRDCALKGRQRGQSQTHCSAGHEFTPENTYRIPSRVAARQCRACNRSAVKAYKARKRGRAS